MSTNSGVNVRLVRNATLLVTIGETTVLVDPLFASPGENSSVPNSPNDRENPLVPMPDVELSYDAVIVTHRHPDHFDEAAKEELDADSIHNPVLHTAVTAAESSENIHVDNQAVSIKYKNIR